MRRGSKVSRKELSRGKRASDPTKEARAQAEHESRKRGRPSTAHVSHGQQELPEY